MSASIQKVGESPKYKAFSTQKWEPSEGRKRRRWEDKEESLESITSTEKGRKNDRNCRQYENAANAIYQHSEGDSNVTHDKHSQLLKAPRGICLIDPGIVIALRLDKPTKTEDFNCQRDE
jgi:hypothetical protein